MPEPVSLIILGTGTFAQEIADMAGEAGFNVAGYVENQERSRCSETLDGKRIHWVDDLAALAATDQFVCGLGTTHRRRFTDQAAAAGCRFATIIHPSARISASSSLGPGTILNAGVIVASHTRLGAHVCVNRAASIGHHTCIGDYVTIGPGVNLAGNCAVGPAVYIGIGATIIDHITIGPHSVIGAGAVVAENVPDHVLVAGVPARILKRDIEGK